MCNCGYTPRAHTLTHKHTHTHSHTHTRAYTSTTSLSLVLQRLQQQEAHPAAHELVGGYGLPRHHHTCGGWGHSLTHNDMLAQWNSG